MTPRRSALALVALATVTACSEAAPAPPLSLASQLEKETGTAWVVDEEGRYGTPDLLVPIGDPPAILRRGDKAAEVALAFLEKRQSSFGTAALRAELREAETDVDPSGMTHVRFDQARNGVPVVGAGLSVHFKKSGCIAFVSGDFVPKLTLSTVPAVDAAAARAAALRALRGGEKTTHAELVVEPYFGAAPVLAWRVGVTGRAGPAPVAANVTIDATSGAVRLVDSQVQHAVATGSGLGVRGYAPMNDESDRKYFEVVERSPGNYALLWPPSKDTTAIAIYGFNLDQTERALVTSKDLNMWDPRPAGSRGSGTAVDAYYHTHVSEQFYRTSFRWKSFDNKGSPLLVVVHNNGEVDGVKGGDPANAFWDDETRTLNFGDGDGTTFGLTNLDVAAHELTHAVTHQTSKLVYAGEPGALNESFSDVFGSLIEHAQSPDDSQNLKIGEGTSPAGPPFRDMLHPAKGERPQPDHVSKREKGGEPATEDNDWAGVHANSGIPNNAFALMVVGGKNATSGRKVQAGGWEAAQRVWWFAQRYNDRQATQFYAHARWMVAAAVKLDVDPKPVACAWVATGVLKEAYVQSRWNITCGCPTADGGSADLAACCPAGATDTTCCTVCAPDGGGDGYAPDTCAGKPDGFYCSELALYSGYSCEGGSIAGGQQCDASQKCGGGDAKGNIICR